MASPSTPTSRNYRFDVFPNFHGPDIRKSFLFRFLEHLKHKGITVFDNHEIVKNEEITLALIQAIRESKISIMVLSKNYASSKRCLDELVEILKCKGDGQMLMKIFYKVDPFDVRKQTGEFGRIFSETCACKAEEERQRWSQALEHISNILGEDFINWEDKDEKLIEKIAEDISDKPKATEPKDFDVMVILGDHSREMSSPDLKGISASEKMDLLKRHGIDQMDFPSLVKNLKALEMELQDLNVKRNELLKRVSREEGRGLTVLPEVKDWISRVQVIEPKAIRILDRSISELHILSKNKDMSQISVSTRSYSGNVHMTFEEIKDLINLEGTFKVVVDILPAIQMQPLQPPISLEKLLDNITLETTCSSPEEAMDLFQDIVGETTLTSHPDIPKLAKIVARKCGGFKFALYLIGVTMSSKRTAKEWYHAIHLLVSSAARFSDTKYPILPILKLSYDILPGEDIRSCFIDCALFPEDGVSSKEKLVDCMIGDEDEEEREITEVKCYEKIETLVRMGLLMEDESGLGVKMHDVVRLMGLWICSHDERQKERFVEKGMTGVNDLPKTDRSSHIWGVSAEKPEVKSLSLSPKINPSIQISGASESSLGGKEIKVMSSSQDRSNKIQGISKSDQTTILQKKVEKVRLLFYEKRWKTFSSGLFNHICRSD